MGGVQLGQDVVEQKDRGLADVRADPLGLSKLEREDGRPLLSTRRKGRKRTLARRDGEVLAVRADERRRLPALAISLLHDETAIPHGPLLGGGAQHLPRVRHIVRWIRAELRGGRATIWT